MPRRFVCGFPGTIVIPGMHTQLHETESTSWRGAADPAARRGLSALLPALNLTRREFDIVGLVLAGHSNAEIALRLNMQLQTMKNALSSVYDKLGVSTRLQLAVLLLRDGTSALGGPSPETRTPGCTLRPGPSLSRV